MNHFGKGLSEDKFHCALKGINVMLMPLLMAGTLIHQSLEERQESGRALGAQYGVSCRLFLARVSASRWEGGDWPRWAFSSDSRARACCIKSALRIR